MSYKPSENILATSVRMNLLYTMYRKSITFFLDFLILTHLNDSSNNLRVIIFDCQHQKIAKTL